MGANPSLPNLEFNFKSNCCNGEDEQDGHVVRSRRFGWLHRNKPTCKENRQESQRDKEMVKQSVSIQPPKAVETPVPDTIIQDKRSESLVAT